MRALALTIAFFWGIGQNQPYPHIYIAGVGIGDGLFLLYLIVASLNPLSRANLIGIRKENDTLLYLISGFVAATAISSAVNAFVWDIQSQDILEIFRPLYYFLLIQFVASNTRRYGLGLLVAFMTGILVAAVLAYVNPSHPDVFGFVTLWNPNVVGNLLAAGTVFASVLMLGNRHVLGLLFLGGFCVFAVFTYSKATWLMCTVGICAALVVITSQPSRHAMYVKAAFGATVTALITALVLNFEALSTLVAFKFATTQFGDSAGAGSTIGARWGFFVASIGIAADNPVWGVGISNYERAYDSYRHLLGNDYWETDNPHSAWLYVLACIGSIGFALFLAIVIWVLNKFAHQVPLSTRARILYVGLVALVFAISGAFMLHLLTQYYFWFFTGVVLALQPALQQAKRERRVWAGPPNAQYSS